MANNEITDVFTDGQYVVTEASDGSQQVNLDLYQVTASEITCSARSIVSGETYREWARKVEDNGAAACLVICPSTGKFLLDHRGQDVDYPGTYGLPAGALEDDETPITGAFRELREETGKALKKADSVLKLAKKTWLVVVTVKKQFVPRISTESAALVWRKTLPPKSKLHPAMAKHYDMYKALIASAIEAGNSAMPKSRK